MMDALTELLLTISTAFLVPVILLLLFFFALTVAYLGGLIAEAITRWKYEKGFKKFVAALKASPERKIRVEELPAVGGLQKKAFQSRSVDREKLLDDIQIKSEQILGRLMLGIRLGPILGLAGTLIPLGPALVALSTGDVAALSAKLVVAFTTTVLGLLVGGACFAMHSLRRRWYMQDLNDIEFVLSRID